MAANFPASGRYASSPHANSLSYYEGNPQMYGAAPFMQPDVQGKLGMSPFRGGGRRMNFASILLALLVPWGIFAANFSMMSFEIHYSKSQVCNVVLGATLFLVFLFGYWAFDALRKRDQGRDPTWYIFIFATGLLGWTTGYLFGNANFFRNMQPYFDILNLNTYNHINPLHTRGQQLMDAGKIFFVPDTQLDLRHSMTFKNMDSYCVAPLAVVDGNGTLKEPASYDFWAVGLNCCSEWTGFRCGEFKNPRARAGLRLMRDDLRPFFRLAVQQAEAAYNIKAIHPVLLHWMQDPGAEVSAYQDEGYRYFNLGLISFFGVQFFVVIAACIHMMKSD